MLESRGLGLAHFSRFWCFLWFQPPFLGDLVSQMRPPKYLTRSHNHWIKGRKRVFLDPVRFVFLYHSLASERERKHIHTQPPGRNRQTSMIKRNINTALFFLPCFTFRRFSSEFLWVVVESKKFTSHPLYSGESKALSKRGCLYDHYIKPKSNNSFACFILMLAISFGPGVFKEVQRHWTTVQFFISFVV